MRLLLATHALLWMLDDNPRLGEAARLLLGNPANEVWVSGVSLWEIALKTRAGKSRVELAEIMDALPAAGIRVLDLKTAHLLRLKQLPSFSNHRDPFDHLLIAQAMVEDMTLVSADAHARRYDVPLVECR